MKKILSILCFLCIINCTVKEATVVQSKQYKSEPFTIGLFYEYLQIKVVDPEFVMKQVVLETGWFKSPLVKYNNFGGMHYPVKRKTTASGWVIGDPHKIKQKDGTYKIVKFKVATYDHWTDFVDDIVLYQKYLQSINIDLGDYPKALSQARYNPNKEYYNIVQSINLKKIL